MFKRILVATDGSVHSRRAALTAAGLARALGASLTLLAVYQQPPGFEGEPDYSRDLDAALRGAQTLLEAEAAAIEADGGPPAETEAIGGSQPGQTIVDATASGQYDLLVMGRVGRVSRTTRATTAGFMSASAPGSGSSRPRNRAVGGSSTRAEIHLVSRPPCSTTCSPTWTGVNRSRPLLRMRP
jgi:nucleotide-binding universal stress UspA family protein